MLIVTEVTKLTLQASSDKFHSNNMETHQESVTSSQGFPRSPGVNPRNWLLYQMGVFAQIGSFIYLFIYLLCW
jgi:hypothetical protein